ncbi:MAG: hypothetical protein JWL65_7159 [Gammaproteobacteria bacterium]|nr:hypothetical protein [Gammaproteobacteria bacterium]
MADDNNSGSQAPPILVRDSNVHGRGVFATRRVEKGERIIEYLGERVSHDEADRRYESKEENDSHTFLFIVDSKTVIDAGTAGNDARFFNHSCDPNCESVVEKRRVFIEALRAIEAGEEMTYDYQIYRDHDDPENIDEVFACRCGFANCRGTMLWPPEPKKKKRSKAAAKKKQGAVGKKSAAGGKSGRGKASGRGKGYAPRSGGTRQAAGKSGRGGKVAKKKSAAKKKSGTKSAKNKVARKKSAAKKKVRR